MHGRWIAVDLEDSGIPLFALGYFTGIIRREFRLASTILLIVSSLKEARDGKKREKKEKKKRHSDLVRCHLKSFHDTPEVMSRRRVGK